jgi:hypothetical protein
MGFMTIIWDMDEDPEGNVHHIAEHYLTEGRGGRSVSQSRRPQH